MACTKDNHTQGGIIQFNMGLPVNEGDDERTRRISALLGSHRGMDDFKQFEHKNVEIKTSETDFTSYAPPPLPSPLHLPLSNSFSLPTSLDFSLSLTRSLSFSSI